jgi:hypothetical protein
MARHIGGPFVILIYQSSIMAEMPDGIVTRAGQIAR